MNLVVLGAVWVVVALCIIFVVIRTLRKRYLLHLHAQENHDDNLVEATDEKIQRRHETIEGWLITKKILPHDKYCKRCAPLRTEKKRGLKKNDSFDTDDAFLAELDRECAVCSDEMELGDIVSWSVNSNCNHCFHHECLKEWLLRNTGCPCCRATYLPTDELTSDDKDSRAKEMKRLHKKRFQSTYFCVEEGLVCLPAIPDSISAKERRALDHRIYDGLVTSADLQQMRGRRGTDVESGASLDQDSVMGQDLSVVINDGDDVTMPESL